MNGVKAANEAARFLVELCMLAAFAYWGSRTGHSTAVNVALALAVPLVAMTVWGLWMAPRSARRLPESLRIPVEVILFGLATAALLDAGATTAAIAFAAVAAVNTTLVHLWGEGQIKI